MLSMAGTVRLDCASCGAPLEIGETARYVTCAHCGTSLSVIASGGAIWAEVREATSKIADNTGKAAQATERVADELALQRLEGELRKAIAFHTAALHSTPDSFQAGLGVLIALAGVAGALFVSVVSLMAASGLLFAFGAGTGIVLVSAGWHLISVNWDHGSRHRLKVLEPSAERVREIQVQIEALKSRM